jgi:hypothetical protein
MNCPAYTTVESVKVRLGNKIQFQRDPDKVEDGEVANDFLLQLIIDAETNIEQELRSRYAIPFRSKRDNTFSGLPDHTKRAIRRVVDMSATIEILDFDFGRGGHNDSNTYTENLKKTLET